MIDLLFMVVVDLSESVFELNILSKYLIIKVGIVGKGIVKVGLVSKVGGFVFRVMCLKNKKINN